ncbi:MAG: phenylalanine--tRNA ligase subunit alpha, partial [Gemmatimonadales bacterium]
SIPPGERAAVGAALNEAQAFIKAQFETAKTQIALAGREAQLEAERIDVTLPGLRRALGRRHILNRSLQRVQDIFIRMGFELVEGTEIETDEYNFERLNIPRDHPARDDQDTFYITEELLLRTHTTVVDAHVLRQRRPPMRILTAGRCYRRDVVDATHMPVFHQVDGVMVGEGITFADLKGILAAFAREMFGAQTRTRFQPGYFPFTEPSAEVAVEYGAGWLELAGCGMAHPRVLEVAGIDPERYAALMFGGFGDRPAMVRYGIPDLRLFWENDLRMLAQF